MNENTETINIVLIPLFGPVSVDLSQELNVLILDTSSEFFLIGIVKSNLLHRFSVSICFFLFLTAPSVEFSSPNYTVSEGESAMLTLIVRGSLESNISVILTTAQETANGMLIMHMAVSACQHNWSND